VGFDLVLCFPPSGNSKRVSVKNHFITVGKDSDRGLSLPLTIKKKEVIMTIYIKVILWV
jgi:hypothetical protein